MPDKWHLLPYWWKNKLPFQNLKQNMFLSSKHPNKAQMKDQDRIKDQLGAIKTGGVGRGRTPRAVQTELVMFSEMKFFFSLPQFKHSFFFWQPIYSNDSFLQKNLWLLTHPGDPSLLKHVRIYYLYLNMHYLFIKSGTRDNRGKNTAEQGNSLHWTQFLRKHEGKTNVEKFGGSLQKHLRH